MSHEPTLSERAKAFLQELAHRSYLTHLVGWSLFAQLFLLVAWAFRIGLSFELAQELGLGWTAAFVVAQTPAVLAGHSIYRKDRKRSDLLVFVGLNAFPWIVQTALVAWASPSLAFPLFVITGTWCLFACAPALRRLGTPTYRNPGSLGFLALTAGGVLLGSLAFSSGAADQLWAEGVVRIRSQQATYDCLDPETTRIADGVVRWGSPFQRDRLTQSGNGLDIRPCDVP